MVAAVASITNSLDDQLSTGLVGLGLTYALMVSACWPLQTSTVDSLCSVKSDAAVVKPSSAINNLCMKRTRTADASRLPAVVFTDSPSRLIRCPTT